MGPWYRDELLWRVLGFGGLILAVPATAGASVDAIFEDCQDGRLDKRHPKPELREALADMPADLDEYTNCRELIRAARDDQRGGGGAGPGSTHGDDGDDYGALPAGEGGLPLGPDGRPIDPRGIAAISSDTDMVRYSPERSEVFWREALTRVRALPGVTQKMLTQQLRELERDGIVSRTVHAQVPPHVVYEIVPAERDRLEREDESDLLPHGRRQNAR